MVRLCSCINPWNEVTETKFVHHPSVSIMVLMIFNDCLHFSCIGSKQHGCQRRVLHHRIWLPMWGCFVHLYLVAVLPHWTKSITNRLFPFWSQAVCLITCCLFMSVCSYPVRCYAFDALSLRSSNSVTPGHFGGRWHFTVIRLLVAPNLMGPNISFTSTRNLRMAVTGHLCYWTYTKTFYRKTLSRRTCFSYTNPHFNQPAN